jgi:hypothetical protein
MNSNNTITYAFNSTKDGYIYYVVEGSSGTVHSTVPTHANLGGWNEVTYNTPNTAMSSITTDPQDGAVHVYAYAIDSDGNRSELYESDLLVPDLVAPVISGKSAAKRGKDSVTITLTSTESGTVYYITSANVNTVYSAADVVKSGQKLGTINVGQMSKTVPIGKNIKAIYVVAVDAAGNASTPLKIVVPAIEQVKLAKPTNRASKKQKISYSKVSNTKTIAKAKAPKKIVKAISQGKVLTKGVDYKIAADERTITFDKNWLNTLTPGVHFVQVYFKIGGMTTVTVNVQN